jgi:hypothetical protein
MYSYKQAHVQCSLIQDIYFGSFYFDFYQILIVFNKFKIMSEVIPEADLEGGVRKNYWFRFNAFLISLIGLYFRMVLVNTARPDGAFLFVV